MSWEFDDCLLDIDSVGPVTSNPAWIEQQVLMGGAHRCSHLPNSNITYNRGFASSRGEKPGSLQVIGIWGREVWFPANDARPLSA